MEGSSRAINLKEYKGEEFPEELREEAIAAFTLCHMKNSRPAPEDMPIIKPPVSFVNIIGECSQACERQLTSTDVNPSQNRLNIRKDFAMTHLEPMLRPNESLQSGIQVQTYDSEGKAYEMTFKIWGGRSHERNGERNKFVHVLNGGWNRFVVEHELEELDNIKLWMFRHSETQNLCFVIMNKPSLPTAYNARVQPKTPARKRR